MNVLIIIYILLHFTICAAVGWLLVLQKAAFWRVVLCWIQFGILWNLAGLIWLGYDKVWPGEFVITGGFCVVVIGLLFLRQPLITHHTSPSHERP